MSHIHPKVDNFLNKFSPKKVKIVTIILTILIFIDFLLTGFALKMFFVRLVNNYDLELANVEKYIDKYNELYENPTIKYIVDTFWNDEKMLKTFPNIKVTKKDGSIIWICDLLKDIQPYYFRVFTPKT